MSDARRGRVTVVVDSAFLLPPCNLKGTICHQAAFPLSHHIWDLQLLDLIQWAAAFTSGDVWVSPPLGCLSLYLPVSGIFSFLGHLQHLCLLQSLAGITSTYPHAYQCLFHSHSSLEIKNAMEIQQGWAPQKPLSFCPSLPYPIVSGNDWWMNPIWHWLYLWV